jgi:protein archease
VSYEWVEHTAELELDVRAPTEALVFHATMRALAELLDSPRGEPRTYELEVDAPDRPALLVRWLEELLFLAETQGFLPEDAEIEASETRLRATVRGRVGEPRPLVKAVTYHGLEFEPEANGWRAKVVLDV